MSDESFLVFEVDFSVVCWEPVGVEFGCNAGNLLLSLTGIFFKVKLYIIITLTFLIFLSLF